MVEESGLDKRRKALEEMFFAKKNVELLEGIRAQVTQEKAQAKLAAELGMADAALVKGLFMSGILAESLTALSLVPLVAVAWADGNIANQEREAVMKAAEEKGVTEGTASWALLNNWLESPPNPELIDHWCEYVARLKEVMAPAEHRKLGEDLIGRARQVAAAAGGFLGIGRISDAEEAVLNKLKQPFA